MRENGIGSNVIFRNKFAIKMSSAREENMSELGERRREKGST
jgi:hypothetical protein